MKRNIIPQLLATGLIWTMALVCHGNLTAQDYSCGTELFDSGRGGMGGRTSGYWSLGKAHTPKNHLRLLVVCVGYNGVDDPLNTTVPKESGWETPENGYAWESDFQTLPTMLQNRYPAISGMNDLFNADSASIGLPGQTDNLSQYYWEMSNKKFFVSATVYPQQVPVDYIGEDDYYLHTNYAQTYPWNPLSFIMTQGGTKARFHEMGRRALTWIAQNDPGFDWGALDNRQNNPNNDFDNTINSRGDSILDYVVFLHRESGSVSGEASLGGIFPIPNTHYAINGASGHFEGPSSQKKLTNIDYFTHEFAHQLYGAKHTMGANARIHGSYYNQHIGWGMMSRVFPILFTANAWERELLCWMNDDKEIVEITSDTTVWLHDFMDMDTSLTVAKAIKIPIPGYSGQYLWLENHQLQTTWDYKPFFKNPVLDMPDISPGVFAYVGPSKTLAGSNGLRTYTSFGDYDIMRVGNTLQAVPGVDPSNQFPTFDRDSAQYRMNPFHGNNHLQVFGYDIDGDGQIPFDSQTNSGSSSERHDIWRELINGVDVPSYAVTGDDRIAYTVGDKIGLNSSSVVKPHLTYSQTNEKFPVTSINGVEISFLNRDINTGAMEVQVKFDVYDINVDTRWCGPLVLPDLQGNTLTVGSGKTLTLDLSGTADRITLDPLTGTHSNPSSLKIKNGANFKLNPQASFLQKEHSLVEIEGGGDITLDSNSRWEASLDSKVLIEGNGIVNVKDHASWEALSGSHIVIEGNGKAYIKDHALLELKSGSTLEVMPFGELHIGKHALVKAGQDCLIRFHHQSKIYVEDFGEIIVEEGGLLNYIGQTSLELIGDNACLNIQGRLALGNMNIYNTGLTIFKFSGNGFIRLGLEPSTNFMTGNVSVDGNFCLVNLTGNGSNDLILEIDPDSYFFPESNIKSFFLQEGLVNMGKKAQILLPDFLGVNGPSSALQLHDLTITSLNEEAHHGIFLFDQLGHNIRDITILYGNPGLSSFQTLNPNGLPLTLKRVNFTSCETGLYTFGRHAELEACNFSGNITGWQADATSSPGLMTNCFVTDNTSYGVQQFGTGGLTINNSRFNYNQTGIKLAGGGTLSGTCNEITHNSVAGIALHDGAQLDFSYPSNIDYPQNDISDNLRSISLDKAGYVALVDGYNTLKPAPGNGPRTISGTQDLVVMPPFNIFPAYRNQWNLSQIAPVSGTDYDVTDVNTGLNIFYYDPNPEYVPCGQTPCPTCPPGDDEEECPTCESLRVHTGSTNAANAVMTGPLNEVLAAAINEIQKGSELEAASRLLQILQWDFAHIDANEAYLLALAQRKLVQTLQRLKGYRTFEADSLRLEGLNWLSRRAQHEATYKSHLQARLDQAAWYATEEQYDEAKNRFNSAATFARTADQAVPAHWSCLLELNADFEKGLINPTELLSLAQQCSAAANEVKYTVPLSDTSFPTLPILQVSPNPVSEYLNLKVDLPQEGHIQLELMDMQGRIVKTIASRYFQNGTHTFREEINMLSGGMYIVRLSSDSFDRSQLVLVEK